MSEFKLPAYRLPIDLADKCINVLRDASEDTFEPQPHPPHLTLLRQSLFGGRVGLDIPTQYAILREHIEATPKVYSLSVQRVENLTRKVGQQAVLAIILTDPSGEYEEEYSSIRQKVPERIRGNLLKNVPHITLGRLGPELVTSAMLTQASETLPPVIDFGPLRFSAAVMEYHQQVTTEDQLTAPAVE